MNYKELSDFVLKFAGVNKESLQILMSEMHTDMLCGSWPHSRICSKSPCILLM